MGSNIADSTYAPTYSTRVKALIELFTASLLVLEMAARESRH